MIFQQGIDLVDFAAFTLLGSDEGRSALRRYYDPYFELAHALHAGLVIDTPTWRANLDWGRRQDFDRSAMIAFNELGVHFVEQIAGGWPTVQTVINGAIGPRGDGYVVTSTMSVAEATDYHSMQTGAFAAAGAAMVTAVTMNYVEEAIGITMAAEQADIAVAVSFTVETDGRLPSGQPLGEAVEEVDQATGARTGVLHDQLRLPDPLRPRPPVRRGLGRPGERRPGQRLCAQPCGARRSHGARPR